MPKVSVILTSYNHEKYIREAIDSVLAQTFTDFELIIWDDASSDESWDVIKSYSDSRIKAFRNETTQRYVINSALKETARGEYIAVHHSDDSWELDKLEKQVAFLDNNSQIGAVFTQTSTIGEDSNPLNDPDHFYSNIFDQPNRTRHEWLNHFFYKGNALCHPSVLIRKRCYDECGAYRYGLTQVPDFDMWIRLCMKYEIHVMPERLVRFRVRDNEANSSGSRPETRIRIHNELHFVVKNYLQLSKFDELAAVFPEAQNYYRPKGFEPKFVLGTICLESNSPTWANLFGMDLLLDLITDEKTAKKIKTVYGFNHLDLIAITGKHDVFNFEAIKVEIESRQLMLNSLSWHLTRPVRWFGKILEICW